MSDETLKATDPLGKPVDPDSTLPMSPQEKQQAAAAIGPGKIIEGRFRYELKRRLGSGGFGSVFEATCLNRDPGDPNSPPDTVAIKVFHAPERSEATGFLKRELVALLAMKHPRIPRVYDWAVSDRLAYVVFKYYRGGSLQDHRHFMGKMETEMAWRLLTDLLSALKAAHREAIVHLDIKPANVLIDSDGGFVLTDFGISQGALVPWHIVDPGMGTVGYQSPEQRSLAEDEIDQRTDLWGVGATLWALYTGKELTRERELYQGGVKGAQHGYPPMSKFRPDCPWELEQVVMSLLHLSPKDRPGSAAEVLATIRSLRGEGRLSSDSYQAIVSAAVTSDEVKELIDQMMDPLWISICKAPGFDRHIVRFEDGQLISAQGEASHHTYVLLKGAMRIERNGRTIAVETREGAFIGEIATLTGRERTASIHAQGIVYACLFNSAELERLVTFTPAVGIRMIHSMAERLANERLGNEER